MSLHATPFKVFAHKVSALIVNRHEGSRIGFSIEVCINQENQVSRI